MPAFVAENSEGGVLDFVVPSHLLIHDYHNYHIWIQVAFFSTNNVNCGISGLESTSRLSVFNLMFDDDVVAGM